MTAEDDWDEMPPSSIALASVWPILAGERVTLHDDACSLYQGADECTCRPLRLNGPTGLA